MQTFLPLPNFHASARVLDYRRLGNQRKEARQILKALREGGAWSNHPAVLMWTGYEDALISYGNVMIEEWVKRGYKNTMEILLTGVVEIPHWIGNYEFHASHRSNLLRKDPIWYGQFGWFEPSELPYFWPVRKKVNE